jgi:hypothetical protein
MGGSGNFFFFGLWQKEAAISCPKMGVMSNHRHFKPCLLTPDSIWESQLILFSLHPNKGDDQPKMCMRTHPQPRKPTNLLFVTPKQARWPTHNLMRTRTHPQIRKPTNHPILFSLHLNSTAAIKTKEKGTKENVIKWKQSNKQEYLDLAPEGGGRWPNTNRNEGIARICWTVGSSSGKKRRGGEEDTQ